MKLKCIINLNHQMRRRAGTHSLEGAEVWGVFTELSFCPPMVSVGVRVGGVCEPVGLSTCTRMFTGNKTYFRLKFELTSEAPSILVGFDSAFPGPGRSLFQPEMRLSRRFRGMYPCSRGPIESSIRSFTLWCGSQGHKSAPKI